MRYLAILATVASFAATPAYAEFDGSRVYWPVPKNSNAFSVSRFDGRANFDFTALGQYPATLDVAPDLWIAGYTRSQPVFGRTAFWQVLLPFGSLDTDSSVPLPATNMFADGVGDLQVQGTINVYGAPGLMVKDFLRFDQPLLVNFGVQGTFPTGTYDGGEALNLGSNRYNVRVHAPIVWQLGEWVPGRRMTLEVMPAVRWFSDNNNALGERMEQDLLYSVEAHLTRDMTKNAYLSLDYTYLNGGEQTFYDKGTGAVTGTSSGISAHFLGASVGYKVNDNLSLNLSHMQAVSGDVGGLDIDASVTKFQLVWSWHDVLERRADF